jgi:WD40 repeat protein
VASNQKPITNYQLPITNYQTPLLTRLWQGKFQVDTVSGGHRRAIYSVAFSPNSQLLASSGGDRTIEIWYPGAKRLLQTYIAHRKWVSSLAFMPDKTGQKTMLASGSGDRTVKLWNLRHRRLIRTFVGHKDWVSAVAFSPNGRILASGSKDRTIKIWREES